MNFHPNAMAAHQMAGAGRNYAYIRQPIVGSHAGLSHIPLNLMQTMQPSQAVLSGNPMMLQHPNIAQPGQVLLRQGQPLLLRQPGTNLLQQQAQGFVHNGLTEVPVSGMLSSRYNLNLQGQNSMKVNALLGQRVNMNHQGQAQLLNARVNLNSPQQAANGAMVRNLMGNNIQIQRPAFVLQNGQNMFTSTVSSSPLQTHTIVTSSNYSQLTTTSSTEVRQPSESSQSPQEASASPKPTLTPENSGSVHETSTSSPPCSELTTESLSNTPQSSETTMVSVAESCPSTQGSKLVIPTETRVLHREKPYDRIIRPNYIALTDPKNHTSNKKDSKDLLIESLQKELQRLQKENSELKVENMKLKGGQSERVSLGSTTTSSEPTLVSVNSALEQQGGTVLRMDQENLKVAEEEEIDEDALLNTDSQTDSVTLGASTGNPEVTLEDQSSDGKPQSDSKNSVQDTTNIVSMATNFQSSLKAEADLAADNKNLPRASDIEAQ